MIINDLANASQNYDKLLTNDKNSFGKIRYGPHGKAKVVTIIDGIEDNVPGKLNKTDITGNTIVLETARKEYLLFAHIQNETQFYIGRGDWVK